MARWGKSFVVPLDSLIKEKENTNRPVAARSAGTVGKWGKMGFTSTRTYAFKALATAATVSVNPVAITDTIDTSNNFQTNDPSKPKKFFKSRNATVDMVRTQIIQHLPRAPSSPTQEISPKKDSTLRVKIVKSKTEIRKSISFDRVPKSKKKKEEKKWKPEAPPSRIISRQRKVVNYNEDDEEERCQIPLKDVATVPTLTTHKIIISEKKQNQNISNKTNVKCNEEAEPDVEEKKNEQEETISAMEPLFIAPLKQLNVEQPPIVLRISKGTSRLISTDSEEVINSLVQQFPVIEQQQTPTVVSTEELLAVLSEEAVQQQVVERIGEKSQAISQLNSVVEQEVSSIESKTSQNNAKNQKYDSLKIIIKTDTLKKKFISEKYSKKSKNKKHRKIGSAVKLKTSLPKFLPEHRILMSSPSSERDFDSQSSILGSVSSKEMKQFVSIVTEDSCVVRSRGSSDFTSDLETSQHSSLVAPPSDTELRLESMMDCDGLPPLGGVTLAVEYDEADNALTRIGEVPFKEDILQALTEDNMRKIEEEESINKSETHMKKKNLLKSEEAKNSLPQFLYDGAVTRRIKRSKRRLLNSSHSAVLQKVNSNNIKKINKNNNRDVKNISAVLPATRNYSQKRKNVQASLITQFVSETRDEKITSSSNLSDTLIIVPNNIQSEINIDTEDIDRRNESTIDSMINEIPSKTKSYEKNYEIKNKFKRTWCLEEGGDHSTDGPVRKRINSSVDTEEVVRNKNNKSSFVESGNYDESLPFHLMTNIDTDNEKPCVKLVISKKKGSIFKSRALITDQESENNASKKRAIYKHTWDDITNMGKEKSSSASTTPSDSGETLFEDDFSNETTVTTKFSSHIARQNISCSNGNSSDKFDNSKMQTTNVKCNRKVKDYYTVVRNVKTAHQIQEIGEYQEMKDDVDYILDALQPHNPISTRCLSALQLATKCMIPAFRMHLRAHATVGKFFKALKDAKNDLSLGLCTATVMFVLSQDTLNIDLDRDSLELMMNLLEIDVNKNSTTDSEENSIYERNKQKVRELCEDIKNQGKALHLNLDTISIGTLAMETLLSLTSKKAGEWFKDELRELGGLEHIVKTICYCCYQITDYVVNWTEYLLDKLRTIERCLRVLENVSQQNETNQNYILSYNNGYALDTLFKLYKLCDSEIALYPTTDHTPKDNPGIVLRETLVPTLKVLINLTHPFDNSAIGSMLLGQRSSIFDTSFHILLQAPNYVPERCIFELSILVLLLLINLTMYTIPNRTLIMKSHAPSDFGNQFDKIPAIRALIEYFYRCQEQAQLAEQNTDEILENPESSKKKPQSQEEMDETVSKLLQKAGHHMEHTLQASYAGILIGHLVSESQDNEKIIRSYLRNNNFEDIVNVLKKYYTFMDLTASSEASVVSHIKSTKNLIDYFIKCDTIQHSNNSDDNRNENHHQQQLNNNSNNGRNDNELDISSPSSSISTRSAKRYKSYSGHR